MAEEQNQQAGQGGGSGDAGEKKTVSVSFNVGPLAGLFDFGFTKFITLGVIKVIYILGLIAIALGWLILLITGFISNIWVGLAVLIVGPIIAVLYAIFFRVYLELIMVIFRISENTAKIAASKGL